MYTKVLYMYDYTKFLIVTILSLVQTMWKKIEKKIVETRSRRRIIYNYKKKINWKMVYSLEIISLQN